VVQAVGGSSPLAHPPPKVPTKGLFLVRWGGRGCSQCPSIVRQFVDGHAHFGRRMGSVSGRERRTCGTKNASFRRAEGIPPVSRSCSQASTVDSTEAPVAAEANVRNPPSAGLSPDPVCLHSKTIGEFVSGQQPFHDCHAAGFAGEATPPSSPAAGSAHAAVRRPASMAHCSAAGDEAEDERAFGVDMIDGSEVAPRPTVRGRATSRCRSPSWPPLRSTFPRQRGGAIWGRMVGPGDIYVPQSSGGECTPGIMFQYSTFLEAKPLFTNVTTLVSSNVIM
jgi:hypothetical protein